MENRKQILTKEKALQKLERMALEIAEQLSEEKVDLYLIGIEKKGVIISQLIQQYLKPYFKNNIHSLSVSLNKDEPNEIVLSKTVNFNNCNVIIIDDVANSGKSLMYAIKPILEFLPKRIQTLVLVERTYKKFPIKPDYIGLSIATTIQEHISVEFTNGEITGAYLI